jgi:CHASE2 domain-containing protein
MIRNWVRALRSSRKWRQRISFVIPFLLACLITLGLETLAEVLIEPPQPGIAPSALAPSVFELSGIYQRLVASGPRKPVPRFTVVVALNPASESSLSSAFSNVCQQRTALAHVIKAIAEFSPAVIAVDKYFVDKCEKDREGTDALTDALKDVSVGQAIPIVIGRRIEQAWQAGSDEHDQSRRLLATLELAPCKGIREGIVNVDRDTKRLPLGWTVVPNGRACWSADTTRSTDDRPEWRQTLALEAAEAYDIQLLNKYPLLRDLIKQRQHPYISFLRLEDIKNYAAYSALEIVCGSNDEDVRRWLIDLFKTQTPCSHSGRDDLIYLRGRIVVIGDIDFDRDAHFSVDASLAKSTLKWEAVHEGRVAGFLLHANYIEALLDQRYFRPVTPWVNYAAGFLIYLALHWVLVRHHHAVQTAVGWRVIPALLKAIVRGVGVIAGSVAVLYLIVMHLGWYVNPATMGLVVIVIKFGELIFAAVPSDRELEASGESSASDLRTPRTAAHRSREADTPE